MNANPLNNTFHRPKGWSFGIITAACLILYAALLLLLKLTKTPVVLSNFEFLWILLFLFLGLIPCKKIVDNFPISNAIHKMDAIAKRHFPILAGIASLAIVLFLFGADLSANWGVIDDHEIFYFLGRDQNLSIGNFLSILASKTDLNPDLLLPRFRPVYYVLRVAETLLWGRNVHLWYLARLVLLFFCILLSLSFIRSITDHVVGLVILFYILTFVYWADCFAHLGPSETYALPGFAVFLLAYKKLWIIDSARVRNYPAWLGLALGSLLCMGSKENFLFLILPVLFLFLLRFRFYKQRWEAWLAIAIILLFSYFIVSTIDARLDRQQLDVYNNPTSILDRIGALFQLLKDSGFIFVQFPIIVLALISFLSFIFAHKFFPGLKNELIGLSLTTGIVVLFYAIQLYFYNWNLPYGNRYDFPGLLWIPASLIIIYSFTSRMLKKLRKDTRWGVAIKMSFLIALICTLAIKGYGPVITGVQQNVERTQEFFTNFQGALQEAQKYPEMAVVLKSTNALDYEPIISFTRYFYAFGMTRPLFLEVNMDASSLESKLDVELSQRINSISTQGDGQSILPIASLERYPQCIKMSLPYGDRLPCK